MRAALTHAARAASAIPWACCDAAGASHGQAGVADGDRGQAAGGSHSIAGDGHGVAGDSQSIAGGMGRWAEPWRLLEAACDARVMAAAGRLLGNLMCARVAFGPLGTGESRKLKARKALKYMATRRGLTCDEPMQQLVQQLVAAA